MNDAPGGLEVWIESEERWLPVHAPLGSVVVNVGDALQAWTKRLAHSALHRVVLPPKADPVEKARIVAGFFVGLNADFQMAWGNDQNSPTFARWRKQRIRTALKCLKGSK